MFHFQSTCFLHCHKLQFIQAIEKVADKSVYEALKDQDECNRTWTNEDLSLEEMLKMIDENNAFNANIWYKVCPYYFRVRAGPIIRVVQSSHFSATFCHFGSKQHKSELEK